ncbi:MAG: Na+/H+ antiporter NhaC family protein [Phycisphaerae bacterium]
MSALAALLILPVLLGQTGAVPTEPPAASQPQRDVGEVDRPPVLPEPAAGKPGTRAAKAGNGAASPSLHAVVPVRTPAPSGVYGLWALAPAIVAIVAAIVTRQVIMALVLGILTAAGMMLHLGGDHNPLHIIASATQTYLLGVLAPLEKSGAAVDFSHLQILTFTLVIGGMVGAIRANGGTAALVARLTRRVRTREQGQLRGFLAGIVVFFDDYANALIVGPAMRPIFDRLGLSREKLAYVVDSTAAPVASILIGTWLATEIGYIQDGLNGLGDKVPAFLAGMTGTTAFWASIPYRTYALLALVMVFIIAMTGRDFGGMRTAEARAAGGAREASDHAASNTAEPADGRGWWLGAVPVVVLVGMTVGLMVWTGWQAVQEDAAKAAAISFEDAGHIRDSLVSILGDANSYVALLYGSLAAVTAAVVTTLLAGALPLGKTMEAVTSGMSRMFAACIVLVLAWGLSQGGKDLHLGDAASTFLSAKVASGAFSAVWLPTAIFISACVVSFATGTSWGTMGILCPATVTISASVLGALPAEQALPLFYASVGAVLTGAVFGDHCSPISDTTVLSAIASECDLGRHVWTQMPYALVVAVVGILSTDVLSYSLGRWAPGFYTDVWSAGGRNQYFGLVVGAITLGVIVFLFGRKPKPERRSPTPEWDGAPGKAES